MLPSANDYMFYLQDVTCQLKIIRVVLQPLHNNHSEDSLIASCAVIEDHNVWLQFFFVSSSALVDRCADRATIIMYQ